jgi:hypothetical protein
MMELAQSSALSPPLAVCGPFDNIAATASQEVTVSPKEVKVYSTPT